MQRALNKLIAAGSIERVGGGRYLKYRPHRPEETISPPESADDEGAITAEESLPGLSPEAVNVQSLVRRPTMERRPVGYQRDFLQETSLA